MKTITLYLAILVFALRAQAAPPANAQPPLSDYETVRHAGAFSMGATGYAATISPTESSLRRILQTPTAAQDCRKLTSEGTAAGQLYGLLGLKLPKDATYPTVAPRYKFSRTQVTVTSACDFFQRPTFFVAQQIDQGKLQ